MPHAGFRLRTDTPRSDNSRVRASDSHPKADTPLLPRLLTPCQHPEHAWSGNGQPPGLCPGNHGPRSARWCNVPSTRSGTIYRNRMSFPESLRSCTPGVSLSLDPVRRVHPDAYDIRHVLRKNACPYRKPPVCRNEGFRGKTFRFLYIVPLRVDGTLHHLALRGP